MKSKNVKKIDFKAFKAGLNEAKKEKKKDQSQTLEAFIRKNFKWLQNSGLTKKEVFDIATGNGIDVGTQGAFMSTWNKIAKEKGVWKPRSTRTKKSVEASVPEHKDETNIIEPEVNSDKNLQDKDIASIISENKTLTSSASNSEVIQSKTVRNDPTSDTTKTQTEHKDINVTKPKSKSGKNLQKEDIVSTPNDLETKTDSKNEPQEQNIKTTATDGNNNTDSSNPNSNVIQPEINSNLLASNNATTKDQTPCKIKKEPLDLEFKSNELDQVSTPLNSDNISKQAQLKILAYQTSEDYSVITTKLKQDCNISRQPSQITNFYKALNDVTKERDGNFYVKISDLRERLIKFWQTGYIDETVQGFLDLNLLTAVGLTPEQEAKLSSSEIFITRKGEHISEILPPKK